MKKKLFLLILLPLLLLASLGGYLYTMTPHQEMKKLAKGYVETKIIKNQAQYKIVTKRPKDWVSLKEISTVAVHAIVISEDWAFYGHEGVDFSQIKEALEESVLEGKRLRGASTISQQVVKNLFLSHDRNFWRKGKELFFTLFLERYLSKKKILEVYLNIVEFGEGIFGIRQASFHYFKKHPSNLSAKEGAFLAMLLPSPKRYSESFKKRELTEFAKKVIEKILEKMKQAKIISDEEFQKALDEDLFSSPEKIIRRKSPKKQRLDDDGSSYEMKYRQDAELELDAGPPLDEDALPEDMSGLEEEFNVD